VNNMNLSLFLLILVVSTAPFDTTLILWENPTVRFTQLALVILVAYLALARKRVVFNRLVLFVLAFWIADVISLSTHSINTKSVGYNIWCFLDFLLLTSLQTVLNSKDAIYKFISLYLKIFQFNSIVGIVQFLGSLIGLGDYLAVRTWWIDGFLARPNGFLYEASFYAAYIQMGYILSFYLYLNLRRANNHISLELLKNTAILCGIAIVLSGSRLGMLSTFIASSLILLIYQSSSAHYKKSRCKSRIIRLIYLSHLCVLLTVIFVISLDSMRFLGGTGVLNSSAHSVGTRWEGVLPLWESFRGNIFLGIGLGNLSSLFINPLYSISSFSDYKIEGTSVFLEVLAGTGLAGFTLLICFLIRICSFKKIRSMMLTSCSISPLTDKSDFDFAQIVPALSIGLITMLFLLQFAQNILRPYLWAHIGLLLCVNNVLRFEPQTDSASAKS